MTFGTRWPRFTQWTPRLWQRRVGTAAGRNNNVINGTVNGTGCILHHRCSGTA
ncbi:hypothetical protein BIFGAL_02697 [Bifidobacterium gallicum DSM 20093 = LMG 11596]|uniref:Uncharacterized protein n=1 Tax=Bifidobacterium gallicum DSM 20093 = LMG 11596 TaxID=561180 RepID=D1NSE0_9BIFI|nr:hypothetical protein BIFGAL_02697 [Bifidobacterium gallicum DSM 20093 = LMG 11596]